MVGKWQTNKSSLCIFRMYYRFIILNCTYMEQCFSVECISNYFGDFLVIKQCLIPMYMDMNMQMDNEGPDQSAHPHGLIMAVAIRQYLLWYVLADHGLIRGQQNFTGATTCDKQGNKHKTTSVSFVLIFAKITKRLKCMSKKPNTSMLVLSFTQNAVSIHILIIVDMSTNYA